jgi:hypothetical protein
MRSTIILRATTILLATFAVHAAQTATASETSLAVPQSLRTEHAQLIETLTELAQRHDNVANAAQAALTILKPHLAKEEEYVFPPLGLLPALSDGQISSGMRDAVTMADKVKAERDVLFKEHTRITEALNSLIAAAEQDKQPALVAFARSAALHSLDEVEVLQPAAILVGEYVKARLVGDQPGTGSSRPEGPNGAITK